jgi:hypothetical protein
VEERRFQRVVKGLFRRWASALVDGFAGDNKRRPRGLKPASIANHNAALEGPLFHGRAIANRRSDDRLESPE